MSALRKPIPLPEPLRRPEASNDSHYRSTPARLRRLVFQAALVVAAVAVLAGAAVVYPSQLALVATNPAAGVGFGVALGVLMVLGFLLGRRGGAR
jgi:hypothetical protein